MYANIVHIGSGREIRLPKSVMKNAGLRDYDRVEVSFQNNSITIRRASTPHRTLEDRLTAFYGKPLEEIEAVSSAECDWGEPEGAEAW